MENFEKNNQNPANNNSAPVIEFRSVANELESRPSYPAPVGGKVIQFTSIRRPSPPDDPLPPAA
ncbi:MAG: hypothetical protein ACOYUZ_01425 [Patescibacteria group bacterium]